MSASFNLYLFFFLTLYQTTKLQAGLKLKAFADDKINVNQKLKFVLGRVENIVGKGENTAFSPFPHIVFQRFLFQGHKIRDRVEKEVFFFFKFPFHLYFMKL